MVECHPVGDSAWWLLQLAIGMSWSALDGLFFCFLAETCRNQSGKIQVKEGGTSLNETYSKYNLVFKRINCCILAILFATHIVV